MDIELDREECGFKGSERQSRRSEGEKKKMRGRGNDSEGGKEVKLYRKMRG